MLSESRSGKTNSAVAGSAAPDIPTIRNALKDILESKHFLGSKQCSDLLQYVVEHSLNPEDASLKERIIGTQVFGRRPTYDTAEDPVVRVRAADVRKRLAQYYQSHDHPASPLYIELQPGSYRASFRMESPPAIEKQPEMLTPLEIPQPRVAPIPKRQRTGLRWLVSMMVVACIAILGWVGWMVLAPKSPQALFWEPLTMSNQPVLVYLGTNVGYVFTADFLDHYRKERGIANNGPEFLIDLPATSVIHVGDLKPLSDTFITTGDLAAVAQLLSLMDAWKKPFILRSGRDLAFGDLRNRPAVLVGGFNNPWTLEVTDELPFSFKQGTRIEDRDHPGRAWVVPVAKGGDTEDYAILTRLLQSKTGGPIITASGIGEYGTQAVAELLSSPEKMKDLLKSAPKGWQNKNMQIVLHIRVVSYSPVGMDTVATASW